MWRHNMFIANIWRMTQIDNLAQAFSLSPSKYASFELYMNIVWRVDLVGFLQFMFCTGRNSAEEALESLAKFDSEAYNRSFIQTLPTHTAVSSAPMSTSAPIEKLSQSIRQTIDKLKRMQPSAMYGNLSVPPNLHLSQTATTQANLPTQSMAKSGPTTWTQPTSSAHQSLNTAVRPTSILSSTHLHHLTYVPIKIANPFSRPSQATLRGTNHHLKNHITSTSYSWNCRCQQFSWTPSMSTQWISSWPTLSRQSKRR